jgi:hypothetical protein
MSNYTPKLDDCRSRLLDAEALLHHLSKPEYLNSLLEACSSEVTIGAIVEKAGIW